MTYDNNNIFAKILRGEVPCEKVYEDEEVLAFHDAFPKAPVHVLVIPKGEYISFDDFTEKAGIEAVGNFFKRVGEIARDVGVAEEGFRLIANTNVNGGQEVPHFHVHILGGKKLGTMLAG